MSEQKYKIGILSTHNDPFLYYAIDEIRSLGFTIDSIIFDSLCKTDEDLKRFEERTAGAFVKKDIEDYDDLYCSFYNVENHSSEECADLVKKNGINILVNAHTPRILESIILEAPKVGIINCHPGILPLYRGCTCVEWAVFNNDQIGNTVHFMNVDVDSGPIILQERLSFSKSDNYVDVRVKVYKSGFKLLAKALAKVVNEDLSVEKLEQQEEGRRFNIIDDDKLNIVKERLEKGEYSYQL